MSSPTRWKPRATRVVTAADGQEALDWLRTGGARPCIILLDLMMPKMDGIQLRTEVLNDAELACIPVVVLSANPSAIVAAKSLSFAGSAPQAGTPRGASGGRARPLRVRAVRRGEPSTVQTVRLTVCAAVRPLRLGRPKAGAGRREPPAGRGSGVQSRRALRSRRRPATRGARFARALLVAIPRAVHHPAGPSAREPAQFLATRVARVGLGYDARACAQHPQSGRQSHERGGLQRQCDHASRTRRPELPYEKSVAHSGEPLTIHALVPSCCQSAIGSPCLACARRRNVARHRRAERQRSEAPARRREPRQLARVDNRRGLGRRERGVCASECFENRLARFSEFEAERRASTVEPAGR